RHGTTAPALLVVPLVLSSRRSPLISPLGHLVEWRFTYVTPPRMALTNSANCPGSIPRAVGPTTFMGPMVPSTVADFPGAGCGQTGVPAGPLPRLVQRNAAIPPLTDGCPKW